jgi:predicted CXXCH cytochrome family protein
MRTPKRSEPFFNYQIQINLQVFRGRKMLFCRALLVLLTAFLFACEKPAEPAHEIPITQALDGFAGTETCTECHSEATELWRNSHHDLAMQIATLETALGDFDGSQFNHNNVTSRFFTRENQLFVETDGSDGQLATFPIRYTFGVYPLQQYLVEMPDEKIQALGIAWDSRPIHEGGQKWFHVYGDDFIDHNDVLHWTQPSQNWETMCADCHSTGLTSHYILAEDRFDTHWSELNVACEACHGPGARHVDWANGKIMAADKGLDIHFTDQQNASWVLDQASGNSVRSTPRTTHSEINACAGCHSRRARVAEGTHPATEFLDNYSPTLVEPPLYHRDGQILDEVYVYGSFLQSRMYQAGVTCSDCHDPHSLNLRAPGPTVCLQCHAANKFKTTEHQLHDAGTTNCIDCHMPATTYMQIDVRNDHSFRIPRPDLSIAYGVPNACNSCHGDKSANWSAEALSKLGRLSSAEQTHWSELYASTEYPNNSSIAVLASIAADTAIPVIIRASATSRLQLGSSPESSALLNKLVGDHEPLVRWAAARMLSNSDPQLTVQYGPGLLNDAVRSVRLSAASALALIDPTLAATVPYADLQAGFDEYVDAQLVSSERSESHINIANLQRMQGHFDLAEQEYLVAITLNPSFAPGYVNLADLYRETQQEQEAETILRKGLIILPNQPSLHHSLGLLLVRQQRMEEALFELELAARGPDATARFALVYAVALNSLGKRKESVAFLESALETFSSDAELRNVYAQFRAQL